MRVAVVRFGSDLVLVSAYVTWCIMILGFVFSPVAFSLSLSLSIFFSHTTRSLLLFSLSLPL